MMSSVTSFKTQVKYWEKTQRQSSQESLVYILPHNLGTPQPVVIQPKVCIESIFSVLITGQQKRPWKRLQRSNLYHTFTSIILSWWANLIHNNLVGKKMKFFWDPALTIPCLFLVHKPPLWWPIPQPYSGTLSQMVSGFLKAVFCAPLKNLSESCLSSSVLRRSPWLSLPWSILPHKLSSQ